MNEWIIRRARNLGDPETLAAATIMALWSAVLALGTSSLIVVVLLFAVSLTIHALAVESASHVGLWLASITLVVIVVLALTVLVPNSPPLLYGVGGASVLAYQQLVSVNAIRRRQAVVDSRLFEANLVAVVACVAIGLLAAALASQIGGSDETSWLWVPAAIFTLILAGLAIATTPIRWASAASQLRYRPGERIKDRSNPEAGGTP